MSPKLTDELTAAVDATGTGFVKFVHPGTSRTFFVVEGETHQQVIEALREQRRREDHDAIAAGIAQMEAGEDIPIDEARKLTRERLLSRQQ